MQTINSVDPVVTMSQLMAVVETIFVKVKEVIKMEFEIEKAQGRKRTHQMLTSDHREPTDGALVDEDFVDGIEDPSVINKKSKALQYFQQEMKRDKKWNETSTDQFTEDLTNGDKFNSIFENLHPKFYALMYILIDFIHQILIFLFSGICSDRTNNI
jgi:hypothetical protein